MWFFLPLFGLYLSMPFLKVLMKHLTVDQIKKFVIIGIICNSIIPWFLMFAKIDCNECPSLFPLGTHFFLICLMCYHALVSEYSAKTRLYIYSSAAIVGVLHYCILIFGTLANHEFPNKEINYFYPISVIVPFAVFVFFKHTNWNGLLLKLHIKPHLVSTLSSYSFGIYLLHWGVLVVGKDMGLPCMNYCYGFIFTYIICLVLVFILREIPLVRNIVP